MNKEELKQILKENLNIYITEEYSRNHTKSVRVEIWFDDEEIDSESFEIDNQ